MSIVINGSGTVTGLAVGGLPDGTVDADTLATDSVIAAKLGTDSVTADALKDDAIATGDLPTGSVLQVVTSADTTRDTTTSTSWVASTISASITPSSTSSKIFIIISTQGNNNNNSGHSLNWTIYRDSTDISLNSTYGFGQMYTASAGNLRSMITTAVLDSPSTTSSTTYKLYFKSGNAASTVEITGSPGMTRTITLMEIAG